MCRGAVRARVGAAGGIALQGDTTGRRGGFESRAGSICWCGPLEAATNAGQAAPCTHAGKGARARASGAGPGANAGARALCGRRAAVCRAGAHVGGVRARARYGWTATAGRTPLLMTARARLCVGGPTRPRAARGAVPSSRVRVCVCARKATGRCGACAGAAARWAAEAAGQPQAKGKVWFVLGAMMGKPGTPGARLIRDGMA